MTARDHHVRPPAPEVSTRILDVDDLVAVVDDVGLDAFMDELVTELVEAMVGLTAAAPDSGIEEKIRAGFNYVDPEPGLVEWMPAMVPGEIVSVKTVGYHPRNPIRRGLPSVLATTALYDPTTGALIGLSEATMLTAMRTGAASAAVTAELAVDGPIAVGVVGCGAQAVTQIHAISRVRTIDALVVTDSDSDVAASLGVRLPGGIADPEVVSREEFEARVSELDVVCTCTSVDIGAGPVVDLSRASSHLHVNAVGADFPGKTELSLADLRRATVIPDVIEQCLVEGESQHLSESELGPTMADVVAGRQRHLRSTLTVFDSTGWSFEDLVAARLFHRHARRLGLGTVADLQPTPADPYDPYERIGVSSRSVLRRPA